MADKIDKLPISVLIMTQNEEANIGFALRSVVPHFSQVIVVDSFSSDRTSEIVGEFPGVGFYRHKFEGWAEQRNWMLANCSISSPIVFFLDADEYVETPFLAELEAMLLAGGKFSSVTVSQKMVFMSKPLRFAYDHPPIKRIFSGEVRFVGEGAREYAVSDGPTLEVGAPILHNDRRPLSAWFAKHNNNSDREAALFVARREGRAALQEGVERRFVLKMWVRRNVWDRLPLLLRPFFYFSYRYVIKLGFLDGFPGLVYCLLHGFIYQLMIGIKILYLRVPLNEKI
jgi:glycosyltransferase involved in cell wall biosynthesis